MSIVFSDLPLCKELLKAIEEMGFEEPTPIQELAIPHLLSGVDVVGQAQTGTGKTAAFGLPVLEHLDASSKKVQAIVLCPTRELAIQVSEELSRLSQRKRGVFVLPVYGGQPMERQLRALERGVNIVVGTPGRVMDHLDRKTLKLDAVRTVVLDEADEMLDMGFREDIEFILAHTPQDCQRVFFSATMPPAILELTKRFMRDPEFLKVTPKMLTVPNIEQQYFEVRPFQKMEALFRVLDSQGQHKAIIFCSTKRGVDELTMHLQSRGYQADGLHGNLSQGQRDRVMGRFRTGGLELLVATDVAARGLDVDDVDMVINYDIPTDVENYVHRIGRTGRAGRAGQALTFVTAREQFKLRDIMRYTKANITRGQIPTLRDVATLKITRLLDEMRTVLEGGKLDRFVNVLEGSLPEEISSTEAAAALLKMLVQRDMGSEVELEEKRRAERDFADDSRRKPDKYGDRYEKGGDRYEKGERYDERPRKSPKERAKRPESRPMTRLFFNVGQKMKVEPRDFVGAIAGETKLSGKIIGAIEIHDRFSFVDVPTEHAADIIRIMNGSQIRGLKIAVEQAEPK